MQVVTGALRTRLLQLCEACDEEGALRLVTDFACDYPEVSRHGVALIVANLASKSQAHREQRFWYMACQLRDVGLFSEVRRIAMGNTGEPTTVFFVGSNFGKADFSMGY